MANEVATVGGVGLAAIAKGLKRTRASTPSFGGKPYLKFGKDGGWVVGQGREEENGRIVILNMPSLKTGYVCWTNYSDAEMAERKKAGKKGNDKLGEEMALAIAGGVNPENLPDTGWEWRQQQSVEGRFTDGDKREFTYNASSVGGLEALDGVMDAVLARIEVEGEERFLNPMIELSDDWYDHSTWGKTYKPVLNIVGWADEDGVPEGSGKKSADKPAVEDKSQEADEEPSGQDEGEEPPTRRRRRR